MYNVNQLLIANWFRKVRRRELNEEILLFTSTKYISLELVKDFVHDSIPECPFLTPNPLYMGLKFNQGALESPEYTDKRFEISKSQFINEFYSIYLLDHDNTDLINEIRNYKNNDKNIIILTINNYHYTYHDRPILYLTIDREVQKKGFFLTEFYPENLKYFIENNIIPPSIPYYERYLYYREMLPLHTIIKDGKFDAITNFLDFHLNNYPQEYRPLNFMELLLKDTSYLKSIYDLKDLILGDVYLFSTYTILTSRLAIILYRLSFYDFQANKTKIGLFFRDTLQVKSKTINLNNLKIEFINQDLNEKSFRGYILNEQSNKEEKIAVKIAKNLLKSKVNINTISSATKLSIEQIINLK